VDNRFDFFHNDLLQSASFSVDGGGSNLRQKKSFIIYKAEMVGEFTKFTVNNSVEPLDEIFAANLSRIRRSFRLVEIRLKKIMFFSQINGYSDKQSSRINPRQNCILIIKPRTLRTKGLRLFIREFLAENTCNVLILETYKRGFL